MKIGLMRKSVVLQWLISYSLVLVIPVCCFVYHGMNTTKLIRGEISSTNNLMLVNLQENIDSRVSELKSTYQYIFNSPRFLQSRRSYQKNDVYFRSNASEFLKELQAYVKSLDSELCVMIYYTEKDYIITQATANSSDFLYMRHKEAGSDAGRKEWMGQVSARYSNQFLISPAFSADSAEPHLVYCNTISGSYEPINIFVSIPLSTVRRLAAPLESRLLMISDPDGQEVWCSDETIDLTGVRPVLQKDSYPLATAQEEYICTTVGSDASPWYYTVLAPESIYYGVLHSYRLVFAGCILAALILGVVLVVLLTQVNYHPVKSLVGLIGRRPGTENEFEWIKSTYNSLNLENRDMRQRLSDQTVQLRAQYLRACLRGRQNNYKFAGAEEYFPEKAGRRFLLLAFSIDTDSVQLPEDMTSVNQFRNTYLFCADNVFAEKIVSIGGGVDYGRTEDGELLLYLLLLTPEGEEAWTQRGREILDATCNLFMDEFSVPVICAVSGITDNFGELHLLYREVQDVLEYKSILGGYGVTLAADFSGREELGKTQKEFYQRELVCAVQNGDHDGARLLVDKIFEKFSSQAGMSFSAKRIMIYDSYSAIMAACGEFLMEEELQNQLARKSQTFFLAAEQETLKDSFLNLLASICHAIRLQNESAGGGLVVQVQQFVQEHYQDCSLNIGSIADALNRNPKYLSRVFRSETGTGLLDYINEVRIRNAKLILDQQDVGIDELSEMVGYATVRTFRRAFSKVYGTTPRRLARIGESLDEI